MEKQISFSNLEYQGQGKKTRKEIFLEKMEKIVPWKEWCEIIQPHYYERGNGRPPIDLEVMLRMYMISNWYDLSDESCEEECISNVVFRNFIGNHIPDETTLGKFRNLLEKHNINKLILEEQVKTFAKQGILYKQGTIVDATFIEATDSKKANLAGTTEYNVGIKTNKKYYGMKAHIGVDTKSGLVHSVAVSKASEHDITKAHECLHGSETVVYADAGYIGIEKRAEVCKKLADKSGEMEAVWCWKGKGKRRIKEIVHKKRNGVKFKIHKKRSQNITAKDHENDYKKSLVRWKVENIFLIQKHIFGFRKTRLSTIAKSENKLYMVFALANCYIHAQRKAA